MVRFYLLLLLVRIETASYVQIVMERLRDSYLLWIKKYALGDEQYTSIEVGDKISCRIVEYDFVHKSFQLQYIEKLTD